MIGNLDEKLHINEQLSYLYVRFIGNNLFYYL
jgi:hypothetical protein